MGESKKRIVLCDTQVCAVTSRTHFILLTCYALFAGSLTLTAAAHSVLCETPGFVGFTVSSAESSKGSQYGEWKLKGCGNFEEMSAKPNRKLMAELA
jgi:hypothetical protein